MQLSSIDLNLLVIFEALLEEHSVSGAARRVAMSPSGLSHSLGRLRELFDDPLFLRTSAGMTPTPRAEELAVPLRDALAIIRAAVDRAPCFDPDRSTQTFRIGASDDIQVMILPSLLERAKRMAPHVRIEVLELPVREATYRRLADGALDLAVGTVDGRAAGIHQALLLESRVVCLARKGHPRVQDKIALDEYVAEGHVAIRSSTSSELAFSLDELLHEAGVQRRIVSSVSNLAVAPLVVARSDLLCSAAESMVRGIADLLRLQVLEHPLPLPKLCIHAAWHERNDDHAAHVWFRELVGHALQQASAVF